VSSKEGRFRVTRNKQRELAVHVELEVPEDKRTITATLVLKMGAGKDLREVFTLRRGHDRDRDGTRDGGQR